MAKFKIKKNKHHSYHNWKNIETPTHTPPKKRRHLNYLSVATVGSR